MLINELLLLLDNFCDAMLFHIFIFHVASDVRSSIQTKNYKLKFKLQLQTKIPQKLKITN